MLYHNRTSDNSDDCSNGENDYNLHGYASEVKRTVTILRKHSTKFDVIAVRGLSGVVMGGPVSLLCKKELVIVRKPGDDCHQYRRGEDGVQVVNGAALSGNRVLFLDDLESSGDTRHQTESACEHRGGNCVGKFMYDGSYDAPIFYEGSDL